MSGWENLYGVRMIRRLYIHNFRCVENFELPLADLSSALLIGSNGAGKTTVGLALEVLQKIARGTNRVGDLVMPSDVTRQRFDTPMRFEIEVRLDGRIYSYSVAFELPDRFKELRVAAETLAVDGKPIFTRTLAQVRLARTGQDKEANFRIDWHLVALPIVQEESERDPIFILKRWLANMLILRPIPSMMRGDSEAETTQPNAQVTNFGAWFSGLLATSPSAYTKIDAYLREVMPDLQDIKNPVIARESRTLNVSFKNSQGTMTIPFEGLSDGEKCFMMCALVIAANDAYGPLLCFWDEPDNFLGPSEVGPSIMALRRAFKDKGQLIVTSHNPEAIRRFSDENTLVLFRKSHLEPTLVRSVEDFRTAGDIQGSFLDALLRGDLER